MEDNVNVRHYDDLDDYIRSLSWRDRMGIWLAGVWLSVYVRVWRVTHRRTTNNAG